MSDSPISYIRWAKLSSGARFNLATSGVANFPLSELSVEMGDLEITGPGLYGYGPLRERLARKTGAPDNCLALSIGTSMANFVALSALVRRRDDVLVELPTYQPMLQVVEWLGANVRRFHRDPANGWKIDLDDLGRKIQPATKLIVLANLHNPSSALIEEEVMRQIGDMAAKVGAKVFVDEVYLETLLDRPWRSAFYLGEQFVTANSLTKAYGLSGLRCGWILSRPELIRQMEDVIDMTYGVPAHLAERLSMLALDHLPQIAVRARALLERNRGLVNSFLAAYSDKIECESSRFGTTVTPRLLRGDVESFCNRLRNEFETTVVPGHFFEAPGHFRIGLGEPTEIVEQGLARIGSALNVRSN